MTLFVLPLNSHMLLIRVYKQSYYTCFIFHTVYFFTMNMFYLNVVTPCFLFVNCYYLSYHGYKMITKSAIGLKNYSLCTQDEFDKSTGLDHIPSLKIYYIHVV